MSVAFPTGWRIEAIRKEHPRVAFDCGDAAVNDWLRNKARQSHQKNLSNTRVLLDDKGAIAGFYTLALGHVQLDQLPHELARQLPRQLVPVIVLGWLGVSKAHQGRKLGDSLTAHALLQCYEVSKQLGIVAVIIDCLTMEAKAFFGRFDFAEVPGHTMKLMLSKAQLDAMVAAGS